MLIVSGTAYRDIRGDEVFLNVEECAAIDWYVVGEDGKELVLY